MPTYTPDTRQLRVRRSVHEHAKKVAAARAERIADVYRQVVAKIATAPLTEAIDEGTIRQTFDVPDDIWTRAKARADAEGRPLSRLIEQELAALPTKKGRA